MQGRHYRAIVADDDADARSLARRHLERSGRFTVIAEAADGRQTVTAAEEHKPDVTLLDLLMPDADGLETLPRIRAVAPASTVIVISGLRRPHVESEAIAAGAAGFLVKQPSWSQVVADVLGLLEPGGIEHAGARVGHHRHIHLPAELTSGRCARSFLKETLKAWEVAHLVDDAELLTTELVNNAVVHATSHVSVHLRLDRHRLRVEVSDTGGGALHRRHAEPTDDSGRGLFLVNALSHTWGTSAGQDGKTVWFELDAIGRDGL